MTNGDIIDRLRSLTAGDLMNPHVWTVDADYPMSEVAREFLERGISAALVTQGDNRLVGILSATDFLLRDSSRREEKLAEVSSGREASTNSESRDTARAYMTTTVRTVQPHTSLLRAAMMMADDHIHRLPVLDEENRAVGMLSTMDITAAVINIVNEIDADLLRKLSSL